MLLNCGAGEDSLEHLGQQGDQTSQCLKKSTLNIHWKDWCWSWSPNTLASLMPRTDSLENTLMLGNLEGRRRGWQRMRWLGGIPRLNRHEFEKTLGDSEGQGSLACRSPWGCKESDTTEQLNWTELNKIRQWREFSHDWAQAQVMVQFSMAWYAPRRQ